MVFVPWTIIFARKLIKFIRLEQNFLFFFQKGDPISICLVPTLEPTWKRRERIYRFENRFLKSVGSRRFSPFFNFGSFPIFFSGFWSLFGLCDHIFQIQTHSQLIRFGDWSLKCLFFWKTTLRKNFRKKVFILFFLEITSSGANADAAKIQRN